MRKNEMPDDFRHRANRLGNYACIEQFPVAVLWHRRVRNERSFDLFKNSSKLLDIPGVTQTMPLAIYDYVQANELHTANMLALASVAFVMVLIVALGKLARLRY